MRLLYLIIPSLIDHLSLLVNGNHRRRMKKMPHPYYKTTFRCDCGHFDKKFVVRMTIIVYCDNCAHLNFGNIVKQIESELGALAKNCFQHRRCSSLLDQLQSDMTTTVRGIYSIHPLTHFAHCSPAHSNSVLTFHNSIYRHTRGERIIRYSNNIRISFE